MTFNKQKRLEELTLEDFLGHPRASSWIPRHSEIRRIAQYMKAIKDPRVIDAGCGNGIISALLAAEGLDIVGVNIEPQKEMWLKLSQKYKLAFREGNIDDGKVYKGRNIIFNSWMPENHDWSGYFRYGKPPQQMIVYIKSRATGLQPGMPGNPNNIDAYAPYMEFVELDRWKSFGNDDFVNETTPQLKQPTSEVIVRVRKEVYEARMKQFLELTKSTPTVRPYNWEKDMPLLS